jgi:magnesium transporter
MMRLYYKGQNTVIKTTSVQPIETTDKLLWVDLQNPPVEEIDEIEQLFDINIPSRLQQEEIESSSRYTETDDCIVANSNFIQFHANNQYENVHVSFLVKNDLLVTYREGSLQSFAECVKKIKTNPRTFANGKMILLAIFETRVDIDADLIESFSRQISAISKQLSEGTNVSADVLKQIAALQETTMQLRANIIDKQRVTSSMLKSQEFSLEERERLRILNKDITSLVEHTSFLFERLEYLQNTILGLVNTEQNKIIKLFTVVSVIFMPPTLIASMYGMNFKYIPELDWKIGYPLAIVLMISSSVIILFLFRKKKWL